MKMSDVKVGMRLISTVPNTIFSPITVTDLTDEGFRYSLDHEQSLIPRLGMRLRRDGHEHYGFNGEALYEPEGVIAEGFKVGDRVRNVRRDESGTVTAIERGHVQVRFDKPTPKGSPSMGLYGPDWFRQYPHGLVITDTGSVT